MASGTTMIHKLGMPFSVVSEIDGKMGKREGPCPPPKYYNNCAACG